MEVTVLAVLLTFLMHSGTYGLINEEGALINKLFEGYSSNARPVKDHSETLDVIFAIEFQSFGGVDAVNEILSTRVDIELKWNDVSLLWNLTETNVANFAVYAHEVWVPDFHITNTVNDDYLEECSKRRVLVDSSGRVSWHCSVSIKTDCAVDITMFPFDTQRCLITVENLVYSASQVNFIHQDGPVKVFDSTNSLWAFNNATQATTLFTTDGGTERKRIEYELVFTRQTSYYMLYLIIPFVLLVLVSMTMFCLPADSGEKASFAITILLAFSVMLLSVQGAVPESSEFVPVLGVYLTCVMVLSTVAVALNVWIISLSSCRHRKVPRCCRRSLTCLTRALCVERPKRALKSSHKDHEVFTSENWSSEVNSNSRPDNENDPDVIQEEWIALGLVLDKIFFWIYFITNVALAVYFISKFL